MFSCNIALRSAKSLKKPPMVIAKGFAKVFEKGLKKDILNDKQNEWLIIEKDKIVRKKDIVGHIYVSRNKSV